MYHLAMMAHDVQEELSVSPLHTVSNSLRNGRENGFGGLDDAIIGILIGLIKGLLQRREHCPTSALGVRVDALQYLRALRPYFKAFEIVREGIEGWDETVKTILTKPGS